MGKRFEKRTWLFFVLLILFLAALPFGVSLIVRQLVETEQQAAMISGIITYAGTVVLAVVTVWQNYRAQKQYDIAQEDNVKLLENNNKLIYLLENSYLKEKSSDIRFSGDVTIEGVKVNDYFLSECAKRESLSFYLLATENFAYNDNNVTLFMRLIFYFDNKGYALDRVIVDSLDVRSKNNYEKVFRTYNDVSCRGTCFDFERNGYKLDLILLDKNFRHEINSQFVDSFLIDMRLRVISKANIETELFVGLNLKESLKTGKILNVNYDCLDEKIIDGRKNNEQM